MKKVYKKIFVVMVILVLLSNINVVFAVTQSEINNQKNEQKEVTSQIDDVKEQQKEVTDKKTEAQKQVENLNTQINDYENQIDQLDSQITDLKTKINDAEKKIKQDEEDYEKLQGALQERLVTIYENGDISYLDLILSSSNLVDLISSYYMVSEVINYDSEMLQKIEDEKQTIQNEKQELENSKASLDTAKKSKEAKASALTTAKKEKNTYIAELSQEEAELDKQLSELKNYENSISSKIKQMQAAYDKELAEAKKKEEEAKKKAAASKNNTNTKNSNSSTTTNTNSSSSSLGFGWPVANPVIGTAYGVSGRYWSSGKHTGVDFRATDNTPVFSVGDGQVFDTGYSSAYGNYVEIYHGNNVYSFYAHATRVQVSVGQKVTKGQQIMLSGHSGNVTGPHLHFEIRTPGYKYANCVNPMGYLP